MARCGAKDRSKFRRCSANSKNRALCIQQHSARFLGEMSYSDLMPVRNLTLLAGFEVNQRQTEAICAESAQFVGVPSVTTIRCGASVARWSGA